MPTLHNQSKHALSWDMGGEAFACEPWGPVDLPEKLVPICLSYGLPLGVAPVPPELRAQQRIADEQQEAQDEAIRGLRGQIDDAKAEARAFATEVEKLSLELQKARTQLREQGAELERANANLASALADKRAAEDLLTDTARSATDAEERAIKAEARMAEAQGAKKSAARK